MPPRVASMQPVPECRWCARRARSGPLGFRSVEDDLCLVCRGLSGLWDETLRTSEDDEDPSTSPHGVKYSVLH